MHPFIYLISYGVSVAGISVAVGAHVTTFSLAVHPAIAVEPAFISGVPTKLLVKVIVNFFLASSL